MTTYDISLFMDWFNRQFFSILGNCVHILNSIQFNGFSLFSFMLSLMLLHLGVQVVLVIFKPKKENNTKGD